MDYPKSVPSVGLVNGKFVDENPVTGMPGSLIPSAWGNAVTQEILACLEQAGIAPDEANNAQLKEAIAVIVAKDRADSFATQTQAETGTDAEKVMSPLRVFQAIAKRFVQATEAISGIARISTQGQVNSGVDDGTIVTPKKLRLGFVVSFNTNGYIIFPAWLAGIVIQWTTSGVLSTGATGAAYWPIAFPNACLWALASPLGNSGNTQAGNIVAGGVSSVAVNLYNWGPISTPGRIIAIGV